MKYRPRGGGQNRHLRDRTRLKNNSKLILSPKSNNSVLSKNDELHHLDFLDRTRVMGMYLWLNSGAKNADVRQKKCWKGNTCTWLWEEKQVLQESKILEVEFS